MDTQDSEEDSGKMEREHTLSTTLLTEDHYRCSVCTEVFKNPVSIPCGHSYCKHCIEIYWSKPTQAECYACPQCRKRFRDRPVLNVNVALVKLIEERQRAGFSPALPDHCYARPKDVLCSMSCDIKTTRISRAVKIIQDEILTATVTKQKSTLKERDVQGKRVCKGFEVQFKARPGRPSVTKLNRNTIRLTWLKAEADEDCPVLQYMVEYREAGLEGWSSVLTQGSECECTLTVPHSTCYRVRVSAAYGEQDLSKPSEETSVPVDGEIDVKL
nr:E3 ubiquitin-protein ligase TRIM38-like isoform X2 [Misgurnus anguillicaudatus]